MSVLLDLAYLGAVAAASPYLAYKAVLRPRHVAGLRQRLGACEPRPGDAPCVWVHGVSVGEVVAAQPLIEALERETFGGERLEVVISTTTSSGQEVARRRFPGRRVVYYPIDFSWSVRRVFDAIRPALVLLVELELWPNFLKEAQARRVPVAVVNGRISEKSYRGYRLARHVIPLDRLARYCVQTEEYGRRFELLGVDPARIVATGSLKYDGVRTSSLAPTEARGQLGIEPGESVWIVGSTHAPEERSVLEVHARLKARFPKLRLVIAPRHVERASEVAREVEAVAHEGVIRRSEQRSRAERGEPPRVAGPGVVLIDTIGELGRLYAAADVVFVGGSLMPHGGQNVLEPAGIGKPVLFGPHTQNFQETVERLLAADGAVRVRDAAELEREVARLLEDPARGVALGANARAAIEAAKGATARTLEAIRALAPEVVLAGAQVRARRARGASRGAAPAYARGV